MEESIKFTPLAGVAGVDVLSVRHSPRLWRVYHETLTVCTVLPETQGRSEWIYRGRWHEAYRNRLMILEPGEIHDTRRQRGSASFETLLIQPSVILELSTSVGYHSVPH